MRAVNSTNKLSGEYVGEYIKRRPTIDSGLLRNGPFMPRGQGFESLRQTSNGRLARIS